MPQLQQDATHLVSITGSLQNPNGNSVISVQSDLAGGQAVRRSLLANHPELATELDYVLAGNTGNIGQRTPRDQQPLRAGQLIAAAGRT